MNTAEASCHTDDQKLYKLIDLVWNSSQPCGELGSSRNNDETQKRGDARLPVPYGYNPSSQGPRIWLPARPLGRPVSHMWLLTEGSLYPVIGCPTGLKFRI